MKSCTIGNLPELDYYGTESLNAICSNLLFAGRDKKVVIFTSCTASEGKSFMSMHIAKNLARRGKRVCVIDADLRRSMLVRQYRIRTDEEWVGLAHYLVGYNEVQDIVYSTNFPGMFFIPIGRELVNPVELLDLPEFENLLKMLADNFDLVLVDAPPVGMVIDAAVMSAHCDGAVFVIEYNKTHRRDINAAQKQIQQSGCPVLGCIVNKASFDSLSSKHYYNKGYYSHYGSSYYKRDSESGPKKS